MFMSILDEFQFINRIQPSRIQHSALKVGIGDDAAVYEVNQAFEQVVCLDTMVEGVHFTKKTMSPFDIGYKSLAVNLSDLAAMGAIPKFHLVSISISKEWKEQEVYSIYDGLSTVARQYSVDLIGGDTTFSPSGLVLSVTVIGEVEKGKALLRCSAKPGDVLFVTGTLGDSAAGLHLLLDKRKNSYNEEDQFLINRHQQPIPRIQVGRRLVQFERACLNDISDGLASELHEIAEASSVTVRLDMEKIPLSASMKRFNKGKVMKWALSGGEDFELVGTLPPKDFAYFQKKCEEDGVQITKVGEVLPKQEHPVIILEEGLEKPLHKSGYNHFKKVMK